MSVSECEPDIILGLIARAFPPLAPLRALGRERFVEALNIHLFIKAAQSILREVKRKAISVIEPKSSFAGEFLIGGELRAFFFEQTHAAMEHIMEALLFIEQSLCDRRRSA